MPREAVRCPKCHELHAPSDACVLSGQEQLPLEYEDEHEEEERDRVDLEQEMYEEQYPPLDPPWWAGE